MKNERKSKTRRSANSLATYSTASTVLRGERSRKAPYLPDPYDPASSGTDPGVPFVTSNDLNAPIPPRATVQFIYDQIIADLQAATPDLPVDNSKNRYRGSVAGGYSLMARIYLLMRNYPQAQKYAQLALDNGPNAIVDYNITPASAIGALILRPDAIYARIPVSYGTTEIPALSFLKSFDQNDLRLKYWYTNLGDFSFPARGKTVYAPAGTPSAGLYPNWGTTVAEMRLIIAECAARRDDLGTALLQLDMLRRCRIVKANYTAFSSTDSIAVLKAVLNERLFEMPFNGTRWFDMRRLNVEGRMGTITRQDATGNTVATLEPVSSRYTLQIPVQITYYHSDWIQNP